MKKFIVLSAFIFLFIWSVQILGAGIVGDINNDGKIDLAEAVYALQVTSGAYLDLDASCLLVGRDSWTVDTNYLSCDVVEHNSSYYACIESHVSQTENEPRGSPSS